MPVTMMTSKANAFDADGNLLDNVRVVEDYMGCETWRVSHAFGCPNRDRNLKTREDMSTIFPDCTDRCKTYDPLYLKTTHAGLVLETRERNGRDDSDFYAVVWNPEKGETENVEYASTRGWSYPNSAHVDATPEVREAFEAFRKERDFKLARGHARFVAKYPAKGKRVRLLRKTKFTDHLKDETTVYEKGTEGEVFWKGKNQSTSPFYVNANHRFGVRVSDDKVFFANAASLEVLDPDQYLEERFR